MPTSWKKPPTSARRLLYATSRHWPAAAAHLAHNAMIFQFPQPRLEMRCDVSRRRFNDVGVVQYLQGSQARGAGGRVTRVSHAVGEFPLMA